MIPKCVVQVCCFWQRRILCRGGRDGNLPSARAIAEREKTAIDWASGDQIGKQRLRSLWGKTILFGAGLSSKPTGSFGILVMTNHLSWA